MSTDNAETGGSLADRITKPDEAPQPTPTTGTSSNPLLLRILSSIFRHGLENGSSIGMPTRLLSQLMQGHSVAFVEAA